MDNYVEKRLYKLRKPGFPLPAVVANAQGNGKKVKQVNNLHDDDWTMTMKLGQMPLWRAAVEFQTRANQGFPRD